MVMKQITLSVPSTITYGWWEADNRQFHQLWVHVDNCVIELPDSFVAWVDGVDLELSKTLGEVPHDARPNWYPVMIEDDRGTIATIVAEHDARDTEVGPLEAFVRHEVDSKLESLQQLGPPPTVPLKWFKHGDESGLFYRAEACYDGVLVNPILPYCFEEPGLTTELTENERLLWWNTPFIRSRRLEFGIEDYECYLRRTEAVGGTPMTAQEWEDNQQSIRKKWLERFPSGEAFDVRCFDGRTGNTPTWWGDADSLGGALEIAHRKKPTWGDSDVLKSGVMS